MFIVWTQKGNKEHPNVLKDILVMQGLIERMKWRRELC